MQPKIPLLDARLSAALSLVRPGQPVADIGCDHGKLIANLAADGRFPRVIGTDLRPGPLAKAAETLRAAGLSDRAELRLGDGLAPLAPYEAGTVILAGISAQTTVEILQAAPWVKTKNGPRLVCVPATKHEVLRRWLYANGFALLRDIPVQAAGRMYAVIAAEYAGTEQPADSVPLEKCLYGETAAEPLFAAYAAARREKLRKARRGMSDADPLAAETDRILAAVPGEG